MAYKRPVLPYELPTGDELTRAMVGIGMLFAQKGRAVPNIEDTLIAASMEGMDRDDLRVLAVLVTWLDTHCAWTNADRLIRAVSGIESKRVRAFWSAFAQWKGKDRRLKRLRELYQGPRIDLLRTGTAFQIQRKGEDVRFQGTAMRVPAGVLRDRKADVLAPAKLAKKHRTYRWRVLMGPSYRADMWARLEADPDLPAAELARLTYGSFATAWQVKHDFQLLAA